MRGSGFRSGLQRLLGLAAAAVGVVDEGLSGCILPRMAPESDAL